MNRGPGPLKASRIFICVAVLFSGWVRGDEPFHYLGPVETLDNGVVTVQVAPKIGRIVSYYRKGEENWLKAFDQPPNPTWHWNPWGGDRLWPTVQTMNPQIYHNPGFDPVIDGQPWEIINKTPTSLEMKSGTSPELGLSVIHRIELVQGTAQVIHTYHFERVEESAIPVQAWIDTGLAGGDYVLMESDPTVQHPDYHPFKWWRDMSAELPKAKLLPGTRILQVPWPASMMKLGTYGQWIALVRGTSAFEQRIQYDPKASYLDYSSLETYLDPKTAIYEIETLSPTWFLRKGESKEWKVRWDLIDFQKATTDMEKAEFLQKQGIQK